MTKVTRCRVLGAAIVAGVASTSVSAKSLDTLTALHQESQGTSISTQQLTSMDLASLRSMLGPHGWGVARSAGGDLLLYPGGAQAQSRPAVRKGARFSAGGVEGLRARLEPHGWGVDSDADGNVLLFPGSAERSTPSEVAVSGPSRSASREGPGIQADDMAALHERLVAVGWRVESDADGSLLLYPGDMRSPVAHHMEPARKVAYQALSGEWIAATDLAGLRARLISTGWRVATDPDNGLLLYI